jgi:hypothetical protein
VNPKTLEIKKRIRCRGDLQFTGVAAAGIDLAHVQRTTKLVANAVAQVICGLLETSTFLSLQLTEVGATRSVDIERSGLRELFPTVSGDLDVAPRAHCLLGTSLDALATLNAGGVR